MAVTLLSKPYNSIQNWNAAYNSMAFVATSTLKFRPNMKYVCNVYVNNNLIARLKHQPDILSGYGIFDLSRILQNTVSSDKNIITGSGLQWSNNNTNRYKIELTEEVSRQAIVASSQAALAPYATNWALYLPKGHNLKAGDTLILRLNDATHPQYFQLHNKTFSVLAVTTTTVTINIARTTTETFNGNIYEGERAFQVTTRVGKDGVNRFVYLMNKNNSLPTAFAVGDTIEFEPAATQPNIYDGAQGQSTITAITQATIGVDSYTLITTDKIAPTSFTPPFGDYFVVINYSNRTEPITLTTAADNASIINAALPYEAGSSYDWSPRILSSSATKFLTDGPNTFKMRPAWYHTLAFLQPNTLKADNIRIVVNLTVGAPITFLLTIPTGGGNIANSNRLDFQCGMAYLSTLPSWPLFGTVKSYTVQFRRGTTNVSELYTFNIDTKCIDWPTYRFVWLNRWGGWDYYEYVGKPISDIAMDRLEYNRKLESLYNAQYSYNLGDRGDVVYNVDASEGVKTTSGYVTRDTALWLESLYTSPTVYQIDGSRLLPIKILDTTFARPQSNKVGLINLPIEFKYTFPINIQKGGEAVY